MQGVPFTPHTDVAYCAATTPWDMDEFGALEIPAHFRAVVLGFAPDFSYRHLCFATAVLRETARCELVGTNPDTGDRIAPRRIMPGTGCMLAALEAATGARAVRTRPCCAWRYLAALSHACRGVRKTLACPYVQSWCGKRQRA